MTRPLAWSGVVSTADWNWTGPQGTRYETELVQMARDVNRVIQEIRTRAAEAEIWNAGRAGSAPDISPKDLICRRVQPHFEKVLDRLFQMSAAGEPSYTLGLASSAIRSAFWKHELPTDFFGEDLQPLYRDSWFAMGHLMRVSGNQLQGLPQHEKVTLASAAACVMLDPTVDKVYGPFKPDPKGALQLLDQVLKQRDREHSRER